jgi:hypothetical protein
MKMAQKKTFNLIACFLSFLLFIHLFFCPLHFLFLLCVPLFISPLNPSSSSHTPSLLLFSFSSPFFSIFFLLFLHIFLFILLPLQLLLISPLLFCILHLLFLSSLFHHLCLHFFKHSSQHNCGLRA